MKVLHLASWYPNRTGEQDGDFIQRHLQAIAAYMPVHLIFVVKDENLKTSTERSTTVKGQLTETIIYYKPRKTGNKTVDRFISLRKYRSLFRKEIIQYITLNGKPDLIHVHVVMRAGIAALWAGKKFKVPYIISEHWSGYYRSDPDSYFSRGPLFRKYTDVIIKNAAWITAVSADLSDKISEIFSVANLSVIFNVVDTGMFSHDAKESLTDKLSATSNLPAKPFNFLHVSTLHPIKNVEGIFRMLSKLNQVRKDWKLIIVGSNDKNFQQLAIVSGIADQIEWIGSISHDEVPAQFRRADALLMFSNHENLSCVICESLCAGLPVIATKVGGLPEIVNDSNGRLVTPGDEQALLKIALEFMSRTDDFSPAEIAVAAAGLFNEARIGNQFVNLYGKVAGK